MKAIIEIPMGSHNKYEIKDNVLILDRIVDYPYPANYGFIPGTLAADGDPEDVFVITMSPIHPGATLEVEVLSTLPCLDNGVRDDKWVGIVKGSSIDPDFYTEQLAMIITFLDKYKKGFKVLE